MADSTEYKRLPGKGIRKRFFLFSTPSCTLWAGPDHLLAVERGSFEESYKRFYYKDIQSISMRVTNSWLIRAAVHFFFLLILALLGLWIQYRWPEGIMAWIFLGPVTAILLVVFIVNLIRGHTCETHLKTAVQVDLLPSLCRVRPTRRALEMISSLVEQRQGSIDANQMGSPLASAHSLPPTTTSDAPTS